MSLRPTRAAVRALDAAHGVNSASTVQDGPTLAAILATFGTAETAASELSLSKTSLARYLASAPFAGDVMAIELMWASYLEEFGNRRVRRNEDTVAVTDALLQVVS